MALVPLATKGNYFHVYDIRVKSGRGDEFIELFNKFDYGDDNPFHRSSAQVKDGVLCRDAADPDHFYLIGEWTDIDEHRRIRELVAREIEPEFVQLIRRPFRADLCSNRFDDAPGSPRQGAIGWMAQVSAAFSHYRRCSPAPATAPYGSFPADSRHVHRGPSCADP